MTAEGNTQGTHWSTQSISGSPVPQKRSNGEFRRVPSCESTLSTSSSVFPFEPSTPTQERRHSTLPSRDSTVEPPQLNDLGFSSNHWSSDSPPPVDNHRVSFPFCHSSPSSSRPVWQRAHSLNTLMGHHQSVDQFIPDIKLKKSRNSFQITLKDAETQTEIDTFSNTNRSYLMDNDSDSITDGEDFSPIQLSSPTTPINIIISPSDPPMRHQRSKSDCFPKSKRISIEERRLSNCESRSQNGSLSTSPKSPDSIFFGRNKERSNAMNNKSVCSRSFSEGTNVKKGDMSDPQSEEDSINLSSTLPSNFCFPTNDGTTSTRYKLHRQSASQLSKIYESTDEESDESSEDSRTSSSFSRSSNLRRSKSSFELSYGSNSSKSLLKPPPSPLTTHMLRNRERLQQFLSINKDHQVSSSDPLFSECSISFDDDKSEISIDINQNDEEHDDRPQDIMNNDSSTVKQSSKRIKSAGTNKNKRGGFFGLFRGKAMSMESLISHSVSPRTSQTSAQQKSSSKNSKSKSPKTQQKSPQHNVPTKSMAASKSQPSKSSPAKSKSTSSLSPHHKSPSKSSPSRKSSEPLHKSPAKLSSKSKNGMLSPKRSKNSSIHSVIKPSSIKNEQLVNDVTMDKNENDHSFTPKTIRKSLQFHRPDHAVVFLTRNHMRSKSVPTSPDINSRHRIMQVVPNCGLTASN